MTRGKVTGESSDRRRKDWEPKTPFQKWLKPFLDKNAEKGEGPNTYTDIYELLRQKNVDVTENYIYRIVRGDPSKFPNAKRPGYEVTVGIGQIVGDVSGALKAAQYPQTSETVQVKTEAGQVVTRTIEGDTLRLVDTFEDASQHVRTMTLRYMEDLKASEQLYKKRTDIIGKRPIEDDEIVDTEDEIKRTPIDEE